MRPGGIRMIAIAAVIATLLCAVPIAVDSDGAPNSGQTFNISMRVGDSFSYTATTNLESVIAATGTAMATEGGFLTFDAGILSGTPTKTGSVTVLLTANWSQGDLAQTATQKIVFSVYERIVITGGSTQSAHLIITALEGTDVYDVAGCYSGPTGTTIGTVAADTDLFSFSENKIKLTRNLTAADVGIYTISVPFSFAATSDAQILTLNVGIYEDLALTSPTDVSTYVGQSFKYDITTNLDTPGSLTKTASLDNVSSVSNLSLAGNRISGTFLPAATGSDLYRDYTIGISVTGAVGSAAVTPISSTVNVRVYASLSFLTDPTVGSITIVSSTGNSLDVLLSATVSGATTISYAWGDGTVSVVYPTAAESTRYSARHVYAEDNIYSVQITASNDAGNTRAIVSYDTTSGSWASGIVNGKDDTTDDRGDLWIIPLAVGIVILAVAVIRYRTPIVIIAGSVCLAVAAIMFFGGF